MTDNQKQYDENSFRVLKGLEPIRTRPGMYTRTEHPLHMVQEVIDNAADEALGGHASRIRVTVTESGEITISDDGRGIPVGIHPEEGVPAVTLAFTRIHAGGKFDKNTGGAYAFAGGLHGVGVSVTTALSKWVRVEIRRDCKVYQVEYRDGGREIGEVLTVGSCDECDTGTTVTLVPDPQYFSSPNLPVVELQRMLRSKAVLLPGVEVTLTVGDESQTWHYEGGLRQYFDELVGDAEPDVPPYSDESYIGASQGESEGGTSYAEGEGGAYVISWFTGAAARSESYVNLIPTPQGGTHDSGLKAGVFEAVKSFINHHKLLPKNVKLQQEDVAAKMSYVLSAKVLDPEFQGQVKDKLNTRSAYRLMITVVRDRFESWLNANVDSGKAIAEIAINHALARQNQDKPVEKKRASSIAVLPGKLTDCESSVDNEIFLVEGDSAGGSAKMARNKESQAVLPLRGKVLNTFGLERTKLFTNREIHDMSVAFGVEPHSLDDDPEKVLANARYTRAVIMTDADVDGSHIQTLLLTLFYAHMPHMLTQGRVFIALPPLYRIEVAGVGKAKPRRFYALNEKERERILQRLQGESVRADRIEIGRFKGLGEMNPDQLKETSMDPATRRVLPVVFDPSAKERIDEIFRLCMHKEESKQRREWMSVEGCRVEADI
jgi:topoisomerase-4 subunit B